VDLLGEWLFVWIISFRFLLDGGVIARCCLRRFWVAGPVLLANVTVFWAPSELIQGQVCFPMVLAPSELRQGWLIFLMDRRLG